MCRPPRAGWPYPVVVRSVALCVLVVGPDENRVDIGALIRPFPELFQQLVDLLHLEAVIFHDGPRDQRQ